MEFDMANIKEEGYNVVTPILITNYDRYLDIIEADCSSVDYGSELIKILM